MNLHPIPLESYWAFAEPMFSQNGGRHIERQVVEDVYNRFHGITANIQKIMNLLYLKTQPGDFCTLDKVDKAIESYQARQRRFGKTEAQVEGEGQNAASGLNNK